jgi:hypothetical protein
MSDEQLVAINEALTAKLDDLQDRLDAANKARAHVMRMAVKKQGKIEALTEQLEAARADAKEAEAYAEELGKQCDKVWDEAVWAVAQVVDQEMARFGFMSGPDGFGRRAEMRNVIVEELKSVQSMRATLAKIEGEK